MRRVVNNDRTPVGQRRLIAALTILFSVVCGVLSNVAAQSPVTRIPADKDESFPGGVVRLDFDADAAGNKLAFGTDVSRMFAANGCTFSTSLADSFVGIAPFDVGGRSGGNCIATHKPLYQGIITIRFCKPGDGSVPATVTTVGFWTAHVVPDGTSLQAFDMDDRLIGSISTVKHAKDFLAVKSTKPIAYVRIVPDVDIDPDFALDDLVFDTPQPIKK